VLVETIWVLDSVFEVTRVQLAVAVEMLLNHRDLVLQESDVVSAALANFRKRPKVRFSDCLVLEIARKAGHVPLGTFDRSLGKMRSRLRLPSSRSSRSVSGGPPERQEDTFPGMARPIAAFLVLRTTGCAFRLLAFF
jgi:hypothetical protein